MAKFSITLTLEITVTVDADSLEDAKDKAEDETVDIITNDPKQLTLIRCNGFELNENL